MFYSIENLMKDRSFLKKFGGECWEEVDQMGRAGFKFDPDWVEYERLEEAGMLRYYTMYDHSNKNKVGFAIFIIAKSLHCKGKFIANSDSIYIHPRYRGYGTEFLRLIMEDLRAEEIDWFSLHVKAGDDNGNLAHRIGCEHYENVLQRKLK